MGITLTQSKYDFDILYRFHMENLKPTNTPCCPSTKLLPHDGVSLFDPTEYRSMVGALQYLTFTYHDLAFSFHQLCKFMSRPTSTHLEAVKHVLRHIRGILHHGIFFTPGPLTLIAFSNVDWAGDPTNRCSTTGLLVSWSLSYFVYQKAEYCISFFHRGWISGFSHHSCRDLLASNFAWGIMNFLPHVPVL